MKETLFELFKKTGHFVGGRGLARLPFAVPLYQGIYRRLKPGGVVTATADGHTFLVDARDTGIAPPLLMHGVFAPGETAVMKKVLHPGAAFVDVGANIGYFSLSAARAVGPEGHVYAFEPEDENHDLLLKNIEGNGYKNVTVVKKAASDRTGETTFYLRSDNLCAHSMVPREGDRKVTVPTITLDEFCKGKQIDAIKIDVEGAEEAVWKGMQEVVAQNPSLTLIIEFYPAALKRSGTDPEGFLNGLAAAGFTLHAISETDHGVFARIDPKEFPALARGEGVEKLVNLLCTRDS